MSERKSRKKNVPDPILAQLGPFRCSNCAVPLQLELVVFADVERREDGVATGHVEFEHYCACSPNLLLESRALGSVTSFATLFGSHPLLPYRGPFDPRHVEEDDPVVARWHWELEQIADVREFILFAEDAARRAA
ncbi:MAG: hypothetical protein ACRD2W_22210 [Acidimicrobiales bacterium]